MGSRTGGSSVKSWVGGVNRPGPWLVAALLLLGCGRTEDEPDASGGASAQGGSAAGSGGSPKPSTGGAQATGGSAGVGGATLGTGGVTIEPPHPTAQVDLLLMIDNSISMADKQQLLAEAV